MLNHLLTRDSVHVLQDSNSLKNALKFSIDELPSWRFTDRHRRGLLESCLQVSHDSWIKISSGVILIPVRFGGVKFPLLSLVVCPNKILSPLGTEDASVLILLVLPNDSSEEVFNHLQIALCQLFEGRFLQERIRICSNRQELLDLLSIEPSYEVSAAG